MQRIYELASTQLRDAVTQKTTLQTQANGSLLINNKASQHAGQVQAKADKGRGAPLRGEIKKQELKQRPQPEQRQGMFLQLDPNLR